MFYTAKLQPSYWRIRVLEVSCLMNLLLLAYMFFSPQSALYWVILRCLIFTVIQTTQSLLLFPKSCQGVFTLEHKRTHDVRNGVYIWWKHEFSEINICWPLRNGLCYFILSMHRCCVCVCVLCYSEQCVYKALMSSVPFRVCSFAP